MTLCDLTDREERCPLLQGDGASSAALQGASCTSTQSAPQIFRIAPIEKLKLHKVGGRKKIMAARRRSDRSG